MDPGILAYVVLFALSGLVCLASVPRALTIRHPGTRHGMVGLLLSVVLWSAGYIGYLLAPTDVLRVGFYVFGFVFAFVAVGAWVYFCAAYTGRPPRQMPYRWLVVGAFLLISGLKVTNSWHHLYFTTEWVTQPFPHLAIQHQPLYWLVLGLSYVAIGIGFFLLIERFYHTGADSQPLVVLAGVTGLPAIATVLSETIDGVLPLMYEPPGVALFAIGVLFVYFQRFEAIRLTGGTDEPAVFLDPDARIRDYNQAARLLFPALEDSIGQRIDETVGSLSVPIDEETLLAVERDGESRYYEVSTAPFMSGEVETGQLVTIADVTERESYRLEIIDKNEQLEALNRVIRHDIRNDMAVILGWAETLEAHVDDDGRDALDRVLRKSRHVIEITEIAGDFAESLSAEQLPELEPVDLDRVLKTELTTLRDSHPEAVVRVDGDVPSVSVRANEMLSSVFGNLLENAIRHNDESTPEIKVRCETDDESVRVRVADNGPGIEDERKEQVFGKGEKGIDSPGTGLGLYLVHTLTEQFGGRVWIEDNQPKGSVFVVELRRSD
jgi:signal transduction histidine kinase